MQKTFLRSDTDDLIRLQRFLNSAVTNSLRHAEFQTAGFVTKLIDELEKARKENRQLHDRNKQLEEALRHINNRKSRPLPGYARPPRCSMSVESVKMPPIINSCTMRTPQQQQKQRQSPLPGYALPPRRSMSVESVQMTPIINSCTMRTPQQQQKQRQSRMITALKNSRISSSHGDLSRAAIQEEDASPPPSDDLLDVDDHDAHSFQTKRNFLRIQCGKCDLPIRFGVLYVKCQRCKATFHEPCRIQAPLPCVFRKMTPSRPIGMSQRYRLRLGDYCADTRPMVPPLISYCCFHLDNHPALPFDDIYQMDGDSQEVDAITKLFQSNKSFPKLEIYHPVNIAGCIKKFLAQIREPVIGQSYGKEIVKCLSNPETAQNLKMHVEELPLAHIDTLGHLCRHWKRLISKSNAQLTLAKLSECVAPLVFGTTRIDSSLSNDAVIQAMVPLIQMPMDYWTNLSNSPRGSTSRSNTPLLNRNPSQRSNNKGGSQTPLHGLTINNANTLAVSTRPLNFAQPKMMAFDSNENNL